MVESCQDHFLFDVGFTPSDLDLDMSYDYKCRIDVNTCSWRMVPPEFRSWWSLALKPSETFDLHRRQASKVPIGSFHCTLSCVRQDRTQYYTAYITPYWTYIRNVRTACKYSLYAFDKPTGSYPHLAYAFHQQVVPCMSQTPSLQHVVASHCSTCWVCVVCSKATCSHTTCLNAVDGVTRSSAQPKHCYVVNQPAFDVTMQDIVEPLADTTMAREGLYQVTHVGRVCPSHTSPIPSSTTASIFRSVSELSVNYWELTIAKELSLSVAVKLLYPVKYCIINVGL